MHKGGKRHKHMLDELIKQQEAQPGAAHNAAVSTSASLVFNRF